MTEPTEMTTVKLYIRLAHRNEDMRDLNFRIPPHLSARALLAMGFAVDGNQVILTVGPMNDDGSYSCELSKEPQKSLARALRAETLAIVELLESSGCVVEFPK